METLVCENCSKSWKRQPARGRKPRLCPKCIQAPQEASKPSKKPDPIVVEEDIEDLIPIDIEEKPVDKSNYQFPGPTKWRCPSCGAGVKVPIHLDYAPTHSCQKRLKKVYPLELVR